MTIETPHTRTLEQPGGSVLLSGPVPQLFVVLCAGFPATTPSRHVLADVDEVRIGRGSTLSHARIVDSGRRYLMMYVPDPCMSARHARIVRHGDRAVLEDSGSLNGTRVNGALRRAAVLADHDVIELGQTFMIYRDSLPTRVCDPQDLAIAGGVPAGLRTLVAPLAQRFAELGSMARSEVSVLLLGESGTGKEVIARAVHELSGRTGAFVAVNCGALPVQLVESELFGYTRGAFSGAVTNRDGLVAAADRGTLFLDEIGDMRLESQVALLRMLQERAVRPLGSYTERRVDVRIVAATHRPLDHLVRTGAFRDDLMARLSEFVLELPPLRERREDMGIILGDILPRMAPAPGPRPTLDRDAARMLLRHSWPRNVRELEICIKTALVLADGGDVRVAHLPRDVTTTAPPHPCRATTLHRTADERRRTEIISYLHQYQGNVSAVARAMGKARAQVQRWLRRYAIDAQAYRP